jgi:hypothetical protein
MDKSKSSYGSFGSGGSVVTNPMLGLNTNQNKNAGLFQQPKQSNILAGFALPHNVPNPISGSGQPSTIQSTQNETLPPTPQGTPMPAGWSSGLGIPTSMGGSQTPTPNTFSGLLHPSLTPTTPVKSITDGSGNKVDFHTPPPTAAELDANTKKNNANNYGANPGTAPVGNTTASQIGNVANTGPQTANESQMQQNVLQAGGTTPDDKAFQHTYENATAGKQFGALAPYAESSMYAGNTPEQNQGLITAPDLAGRASADTGLYNTLGNAYGNAALAGLTAAQVSAARGLTAAQGAYSGSQTQAQRATGAQESVLGAVQPQPYGVTTTPYSPATGEFGTMAGNSAGTGGLQNIGNVQGQIGVGQNVAQLNSYLGGAQVVGNNLNDLITQNNINPTGLTYANGALQFGQSAMSNPAYQKFAGQINDFVASLAPILGVGGASTDMKTQMSSQIVNALQSGSTIKDVVSYFLDQAQQKIKGLSAGGGAGVGSAQGAPQGGGNSISSSVVPGSYVYENGKWSYQK